MDEPQLIGLRISRGKSAAFGRLCYESNFESRTLNRERLHSIHSFCKRYLKVRKLIPSSSAASCFFPLVHSRAFFR